MGRNIFMKSTMAVVGLIAVILFQNCGTNKGNCIGVYPSMIYVPHLSTFSKPGSVIKRTALDNDTSIVTLGYDKNSEVILGQPKSASLIPTAGMVAFYECNDPALANDFYLSLNSQCENTSPSQGKLLGYLSSTASANSKVLTRCKGSSFHYAVNDGNCGSDVKESALGYIEPYVPMATATDHYFCQ